VAASREPDTTLRSDLCLIGPCTAPEANTTVITVFQIPMAAKTVSSLFPEGYGDFALESQDGVICYFPSQILAHMSQVFRDMITLGNNDLQASMSPVKLTESGKTLELFLTHLDPTLTKASIDKKTISDLLEAAHKYQVKTIMQWFDLEATTQRTRRGTDTVVASDDFAMNHPGHALSLATRYGLVETIRLSSRELCNCDSQILLDHAPALGLSMYLKVQRLRDTRIKRYQKWIGVMTKVRLESNKERNVNNRPYFCTQADVYLCHKCIAQRAHWTTEILKAVHCEPAWKSFIRAYETNSKCCFAWSDYFRDFLPGWEAEALREEAKLPEWPKEGVL
jgi:hypothetical protein